MALAPKRTPQALAASKLRSAHATKEMLSLLARMASPWTVAMAPHPTRPSLMGAFGVPLMMVDSPRRSVFGPLLPSMPHGRRQFDRHNGLGLGAPNDRVHRKHVDHRLDERNVRFRASADDLSKMLELALRRKPVAVLTLMRRRSDRLIAHGQIAVACALADRDPFGNVESEGDGQIERTLSSRYFRFLAGD